MKKVQVNEVREHLAQYLADAERGEEIVITKHSRPVARLTSVESEKKEFPDLSAFRNSVRVKGKPMSQVVINNRREDRY